MGDNEGNSGEYGTSYNFATEVLHGQYNEKCDIWSVGVILYMLLSGNPPFNGASDMHILEAVKKGEFSMEGGVWDDISESAKDLVFNMLTLDAKNRISATDALAHRWISESLGSN